MPGLDAILSLISTIENVGEKLTDGTYMRKALENSEDQVVEANVNQLNELGINSLGVSISTYAPYTPFTVAMKKQKGQPYDRVTLRDTGAFHGSFTIVFDPDSFYLTSTDPKTEELIEKYGPEIFGLTPVNEEGIAREYWTPDIISQMKIDIFS